MSFRPTFVVAALAAAPALLLATPASARPFVLKSSTELSLQLGGHFFLEPAAVPFDAELAFPYPLEHTFAYTLSGTLNASTAWGLEASAQVSPAEVNRLTLLSVHVDAVWYPTSHDWFVPFLGAGPSLTFGFPQRINAHQHATDFDPGLNAVAGVKLYPWESAGFRADLRYLLRLGTETDEVDGHDLIASLGLFGTFGGDKPKPVAPVILDTDGDGFIDTSDACPNLAGHATANGCPDRDGDTLADAEDRCPDVAGLVDDRGCADKDADRIVDVDDRCVEEPGVPEFQGCADGDGDRIANIDDRCPTIAGVPEHGGCPPPPPEEVIARYTGVMKGINFEKDSDVILETSHVILDEALKVLNEFPATRLLIEGHTSSEGEPQKNLELSQRRAASVKAYLVTKGIDAGRLDTVGYGADKPIAKNDVERNRSKNRRIEFKLLQP
jgi:outer membrane protein OmpA-like peptidoglycan-associated protein